MQKTSGTFLYIKTNVKEELTTISLRNLFRPSFFVCFLADPLFLYFQSISCHQCRCKQQRSSICLLSHRAVHFFLSYFSSFLHAIPSPGNSFELLLGALRQSLNFQTSSPNLQLSPVLDHPVSAEVLII